MSTARRLSTNPDVVTARPGRAAVALALSVATVAAMPSAAEAQGDITVWFEPSAESVHEGDPLGLSLHFSEIPDRVIPDGQWYVEIPLVHDDRGGVTRSVDYYATRYVKVYRNRGYYFAGFQFGAMADNSVDPGESVLFEFGTLPAGFVAGEPSTLEVTILDGPSPPPVSTMVTLSVSPDSVSEDAGSPRVTVTGVLNGAAPDSGTPVTVSVDSGTAIAGTDFATVNDFTLNIPANETRGTATFNLVLTNDDVDEIDETLSVTGSATGLAVDSATMTITDDDTLEWSVSVAPATITEAGEGSSTVTVSTGGVTLPDAKTVTLDFTGSTATETTDYTVVSKTLGLGVGLTEVTTTVTAVDDTDMDPNEQVKVTAEVDGSTIGVRQTITITDDDTQRVKLSMDGESEWVMEGGGPKDLTVKAELTRGVRDEDTRVNVQLDPYEASRDDFTAEEENFEILIQANQMSGSHMFTFTPIDDEEDERDESLRFTGETRVPDLPVDPTTSLCAMRWRRATRAASRSVRRAESSATWVRERTTRWGRASTSCR